jgi:hypothetical protein
MEHYLGVAEEVGVSGEELGAAQSIAMAVSAGRINAQFRGVERSVRAEQRSKKRPEKE